MGAYLPLDFSVIINVMKRLIGIGVSLIAVFTLFGCAGNIQSSSSTTELNADDIFPAPGLGPQYRANVHLEGVDNPWPEIKSVTVTLEDPVHPAEVTYRNYIETEAGKTVNNIIRVYLQNVAIEDLNSHQMDVNVQAIDLPIGINMMKIGDWHGADPARQSKVIIAIEIDEQVQPGEYSIGLQVEIDGKNYGQVPCVISVIQP
jgi:hypothetical protein